jgi:hypothetical protein
MKWTIVQHSGYSHGDNPQFAQGLEEAGVDKASDIARVEKAGGLLFASYMEASDFAEAEMYRDVSGLIPRAPGKFARTKIGGRRVYIAQ